MNPSTSTETGKIDTKTNAAARSTKPRFRFPPSPTGYAHLGNMRTALYNYLLAEAMGGEFILRIEDTDQTRYVADSVDNIIESCRKLGLKWAEGPDIGGPYGPYYQSQRLEIYDKLLHQLVDEGKAYPCFCSPERLEELRKEQEAAKLPPGYDRRCRDIPPTEARRRMEAGEPYVIRFKMPLEGVTVVNDYLRGELIFENSTLDDHVLLKRRREGEKYAWPTYHGCSPVDDHLMHISHIVRGDEWLPSSPKHKLLFEAFGWEVPVFVHLPIILSPSGKGKMSKRDGTTAIRDFFKLGYLPEALVNGLLLLGWSSSTGKEVYTMEEAIAEFSLEGLSKSPAAFNPEKLLWFNGVHIRRLAPEELANRCLPYLQEAGYIGTPRTEEEFAYLLKIIPLIQERITLLSEVPDQVDFLYKDVGDYTPETLIPKKTSREETLEVLKQAVALAEAIRDFGLENVNAEFHKLPDKLGLKAGQVFMPLRVAISGRTVSPGSSTEIMAVLGKERTVERLKRALAKLEGMTA
ncbi:MAG: glutamate--tRNA ligase [Syntrophothermus sp.]